MGFLSENDPVNSNAHAEIVKRCSLNFWDEITIKYQYQHRGHL